MIETGTGKKTQDDFSPSLFLVENLDLLPTGNTLDIAMGRGRNAIFLARQGFKVEGIDISESSIEFALQLARANSVTLLTTIADLESGYQLKINFYDLIICFNYLQRSLIGQIKSALKTGGMIVYETFIIDQAQFGRPRNPEFLLKHNELLELFHDFRVLRYREGIIEDRKAIASLIAQKI